MNDIEKLFCDDTREKKKIGRSSRRKVNGSKSRRCTMPSDLLTPAQLKKLNGEVITMNLNEKLEYSEFKKLPVSMQISYIENLVEKYDINKSDLAKLFGVTSEAIRQHCIKKLKKDIKFGGQWKKTKEQATAWNAFLNGVTAEAEEVTPHEIIPNPAQLSISIDAYGTIEQIYSIMKEHFRDGYMLHVTVNYEVMS